MNKSELRIGNLLDWEGQTVIVLGIPRGDTLELGYFTDSIGFDRYISEVTPIPLTEEWLLRFGFEKDEHYEGYWNLNQGLDDSMNGIGFPFADMELELTESCFKVSNAMLAYEPRYVHQLQNICHALRGEELTLRAAAQGGDATSSIGLTAGGGDTAEHPVGKADAPKT